MNALLIKLRNLFLKPDTWLETRLRTCYHRLSATRLGFAFQHWRSIRSYQKFRSQNKGSAAPDSAILPVQPGVTFILSCADADLKDVRATLESIRALQGDRWEVLLIKNQPNAPECQTLTTLDSRFRAVTDPAENLLDLAKGDFVVFCAPGDRFFPSLLTFFYQLLLKDAPSDLTYYDCEYRPDRENRSIPLCKPSLISPAQLLSVNTLSRGFFNRDVLQREGYALTTEKNLLSQEYAFALRFYENGATFHHLPEVLISQKSLATADSPPNQQVLTDHLDRQGLQQVTTQKTPSGTRFTWQTNHPSVTVIIPTKNNRTFLQPLVDDLLHRTDWEDLSIRLIDNGSRDEATLSYYQALSQTQQVEIIPYNEPFNYSKAINLGARAAKSDLLLFLNDDMRVKTAGWLSELVQWASRPEVGVVGTKLLRANNTIQHAGIVLGLNDFMGHLYLNAPEGYTGLFGSADWYRDVAALTGACQMVRREVFEQVGGYDTAFRLAFGDIDFCLRVQALGLRNVYTPFAALYHYEGKSRGYTTPVSDILMGFDKLEPYLLADDPHYSPRLTRTVIPGYRAEPLTSTQRTRRVAARRKFYEAQ